MFSERARKKFYGHSEENVRFEVSDEVCTVTRFRLTSHKTCVVIGANIANFLCLSFWFNKRSFNIKDSRKKKMPEKNRSNDRTF